MYTLCTHLTYIHGRKKREKTLTNTSHSHTYGTHAEWSEQQCGIVYAYSEFNHILYGPYQEFHMNLDISGDLPCTAVEPLYCKSGMNLPRIRKRTFFISLMSSLATARTATLSLAFRSLDPSVFVSGVHSRHRCRC